MKGEIQLGDRAKCKITGLTGIVTCMSTWLNGCVRIGIQPEEAKDGKVLDAVFFDVGQVELVKKSIHKPVILHPVPAPAPGPTSSAVTGGPGRESSGFRR